MVQESGSKTSMNAYSAVSRKETGYTFDPAGGKGSQHSMKQQQQQNSFKSYSSQKSDSAQNYGAWGSMYKNKDHFAAMHLF